MTGYGRTSILVSLRPLGSSGGSRSSVGTLQTIVPNPSMPLFYVSEGRGKPAGMPEWRSIGSTRFPERLRPRT